MHANGVKCTYSFRRKHSAVATETIKVPNLLIITNNKTLVCIHNDINTQEPDRNTASSSMHHMNSKVLTLLSYTLSTHAAGVVKLITD